jgi:hypothetical protein
VIRTLTITAEAVSTQEAFPCASCDLPSPLQGVEDALNVYSLLFGIFSSAQDNAC